MRARRHIPGRVAGRCAGLFRREDGGVIIEFAIVMSLFFFLFFLLLDFGRLSYSGVLAQKGSQIAVRIAVVRPPACAGVPETHERGTASPAPRFGTACSAGAGVCNPVATVSCAGNAANPTASEIWGRIAPLLPNDATINVLQFSYQFDPNLGFLGGPYTPMVTVSLDLDDFQFVSPLAALANAAGATNSNIASVATYSSFSVSLPAEDLALGEAG